MPKYTRIGIVRSATGITRTQDLSDGQIAFAISNGEAYLIEYLGTTPASGSTTLQSWVRNAATQFSAYHAHLAMASARAPHYHYAGDLSLGGRSEFLGYSYMAETFYNAGKRVCDAHGREVYFDRVEATDFNVAEGAEG